MSTEIDNQRRSVPDEPHPDIDGRVEFLRRTYPYPGCERLAYGIKVTRGYIRGEDADVLYRALRPYFDSRFVEQAVDVAEPQIQLAPISGGSGEYDLPPVERVTAKTRLSGDISMTELYDKVVVRVRDLAGRNAGPRSKKKR